MQVARTRPVVLALACIAAATLVAAPRVARADSDCIAAYEAAQVERKAGHVSAARTAALTCAQSTCPAKMAKECGDWAVELDHMLPSVVLSFQRPDGSDAVGARVTIDGRLTPLDGLAVPLDPGPHTIRVELSGFKTLEQTVLVQEGEQRRRITGRLCEQGAAPPPPEPSRTPAIVVASIAGVALALGVGFGSAALVEYDQLEGSCHHACTPSQASDVRVRAGVADGSFAVAIASAAIAIGLFVRPIPAAKVAFVPAPGGGALRFEAAFR